MHVLVWEERLDLGKEVGQELVGADVDDDDLHATLM
jgi:L-ribulose-5-phosphate 3-epimerase UlaE